MSLAFLQIKLVCGVFVENRKKGRKSFSVDILIDDNGRVEFLLREQSPIRESSQ